MPAAFTLPAPLRDRLLELALAAPGREVCALLGGPGHPSEPGAPSRARLAGDRATCAVPIPNVVGLAGYAAITGGLGLAGHDPALEYLMDPQATIRCLEAFRRNGLREVAIFHSHPRGPATPSATDVRLAFYPHCVYLVCSLAEPARPSLRAFRIAAGEAHEVLLVVRDPADLNEGVVAST